LDGGSYSQVSRRLDWNNEVLFCKSVSAFESIKTASLTWQTVCLFNPSLKPVIGILFEHLIAYFNMTDICNAVLFKVKKRNEHKCAAYSS